MDGWIKKSSNFIIAGAFSAFVGNTTAYIFAAPILLWWGMPQSSMSFVGNIVFAPFLSIFILLCALMLGTSLFGFIPIALSAPLERVTQVWMNCLTYGSVNFLYGQQNHPAIFVSLMLVVGFTGWKIMKSSSKKQLAIALLLGHCATTALLLIPLTTPSSTLENRCGKLIITQPNASCVHITDNGYFVGLHSPEKNIPFQVKRHLVQQHGTLKIDHLELPQLTTRTLLAVNELMIATHVVKITLPQINPPHTPFFWRQLSILRKAAQKNETVIKYTKNLTRQNYAGSSQNHPQPPQAAAA